MKNNTTIFLTSIFILLLFVTGCNKKPYVPPVPYPDMTPFVINIEITKNGNILPDSILKQIKISYNASGAKNYLVDFGMGKLYTDTTKSVTGSFEAYLLSSTTNRPDSLSFPSTPGNFITNMIPVKVPPSPVTDYYIEYPNGLKTDTLYLVTNIQNGTQAMASSCSCTYPPPKQIMFNGINAILDTALTLKAGGCINCNANIYLLKK